MQDVQNQKSSCEAPQDNPRLRYTLNVQSPPPPLLSFGNYDLSTSYIEV